jgi:predicted nucleotide-binding protein
MKPSVFVASSSENKNISSAVKAQLEDSVDVTVWHEGVFGPTHFILDSLTKALDESDFAIFIFSPDDIVKIRGSESLSVRDNVIFELGQSWLGLSEQVLRLDRWSACRVQAAAVCDSRLK